MTSSGMILVLAAALGVPATGRASSRDDGSVAETDRTRQAEPAQPPVEDGAVLPKEQSPAIDPSQTRAAEEDVPQDGKTGLRTLFRDLGSDFAHLPSRDSLFVASIGGTAALALHPFDATFNEHLQDSSFFSAGDRLGNTFTLMGATFAVYGVGLATGHHRVTHVAMDVVRAQLVSEALVQSLKVAVRRERPDGSSGYSFPSGHAAVTFATATVLQRHHGLKWALPAYGLATYVAMSRLHDNVHYLSDVVFGATIGTLVGRTVTRHGPQNFAFMPMAVPGGAAFVVLYSPRGSIECGFNGPRRVPLRFAQSSH